MHICAIIKYPPIQGGTSTQGYLFAHSMARAGHQIDVVSNASEAVDPERCEMLASDLDRLEARYPSGGGVSFFPIARWPNSPPEIPFAPYANPVVSRLVAAALTVARRQRPDVVFSWYLEPNCVAGHIVAQMLDLPHVVLTAGSDRFRLMRYPELAPVYREVLAGADAVAGDLRSLTSLGVANGAVVDQPAAYLAPWFQARSVPVRKPDNALVLGAYGKVGESKGTFDLVQAVRGLPHVRLKIMGGGPELPRLVATVSRLGIEERVSFSSFLPPWRVPTFIESCDAIAVLERKFDVTQHHPTVAREVLATGTCLVVSQEIANKQSTQMKDGFNAIVVPDDAPEGLTNRLEQLAQDRQRVADIGARGSATLQRLNEDQTTARFLEIFAHAVARRRARSGPQASAGGVAADLLWPRSMQLLSRITGLAVPGLTVALVEQARAEASTHAQPHPHMLEALVARKLWAQLQDHLDPAGVELQISMLELALRWLCMDYESALGAPQFRIGSVVSALECTTRRLSLDDVPVTGAMTACAAFNLVDLASVVRTLDAGQRPAASELDAFRSRSVSTIYDVERENAWLLFSRTQEGGRSCAKVSRYCANSLLALDGRTTLEEVLSLSELGHRKSVHQLMDTLWRRGALGVVDPHALVQADQTPWWLGNGREVTWART